MSDNPYLVRGDEWWVKPDIEIVPDPKDMEIERLRARGALLEDLAGYFAGRNADNVSVVLWGDPDACAKLIERARAALEAKP